MLLHVVLHIVGGVVAIAESIIHCSSWEPARSIQHIREVRRPLNLWCSYSLPFCRSEIHAEPYKSDVMVNGCSALLQYLMWRKEVWSEGVGSGSVGTEEVWSRGVAEEGAEVSMEGSGRAKAHSKQALQHFETLHGFSPTPSYHMDSFITVHSKASQNEIVEGGTVFWCSYGAQTMQCCACNLVLVTPQALGRVTGTSEHPLLGFQTLRFTRPVEQTLDHHIALLQYAS